MTFGSPLVSVYIPTKNRPEQLRRALASIASQDYKNIQVVVCDDGSTQPMDEIREEFSGKFTELIWIRNDASKGACAARNLAISFASGEYVTGLDDDDEFLPNRISKFVNSPERDSASFICSNFYFCEPGRDYICHSRRKAEWISLDDLKKWNVVGNQIFIKRSLLNDSAGFDVDFKSWQDFDFWFRLVKEYGPAYRIIDSTMVIYADANLNRISTSRGVGAGFLQFIDKHSDHLSERDVAILEIADSENRQVAVSWQQLTKLLCLGCYRLAAYCFVKHKVPYARNLYRVFLRRKI